MFSLHLLLSSKKKSYFHYKEEVVGSSPTPSLGVVAQLARAPNTSFKMFSQFFYKGKTNVNNQR